MRPVPVYDVGRRAGCIAGCVVWAMFIAFWCLVALLVVLQAPRPVVAPPSPATTVTARP
jgi:hypothetical protein